ncbi:MAG: diguanylate cyclase domain-containing protein, partial [Rhodoferax sp.]
HRASNRDDTHNKELQEQVRQLAFIDPLTELPNRRLLLDRLEQALAANQRSEGFGALVYLDLDNFKPLNDQHGHGAGDLLLVEVAHRLRSCVRAVDTVSRIGGDEFVVLLGDLTPDRAQAADQANKLAEKIRVALAEPYLLPVSNNSEAIKHHCSASIGVVLIEPQHKSVEGLLKWADAAMYLAKEEGRNRVNFMVERRAQQRP